jgi:hypothetical protein
MDLPSSSTLPYSSSATRVSAPYSTIATTLPYSSTSSLPYPSASLADSGDNRFAAQLAKPDFGTLASRLAAGLPEQE